MQIKNGEDVKRKIAFTGRTVKRFSEDIDVSNSYLARILNSKITAGPETASKIAEALGVNVSDIFFATSVLKNITKEGATN